MEVKLNNVYYDVRNDEYHMPIAEHCTMYECRTWREDFMGKKYAQCGTYQSEQNLMRFECLGEE